MSGGRREKRGGRRGREEGEGKKLGGRKKENFSRAASRREEVCKGAGWKRDLPPYPPPHRGIFLRRRENIGI